MARASLTSIVCRLALLASASAVTVYTPVGPPNAAETGVALVPPPARALPPAVSLNLASVAGPASGRVDGNFVGWSIELSVSDDILGSSSETLAVPFLNYLGTHAARFDSRTNPIIVRIGGNTQDDAVLAPTVNSTSYIAKVNPPPTVSRKTPDVDFTPELFYTLANISALINVQWVFGLPFHDARNAAGLLSAQTTYRSAREILGTKLLTLQIGNEPDLYVDHELRPFDYNIPAYVTEYGATLDATGSDDMIFSGPGVCCNWSLQNVLDAGWLNTYNDSINLVSVQRYPYNNCGATGQTNSTPIDPQAILPQYLSHGNITTLLSSYSYTGSKPLYMTETNTASCGGFLGISDSFVSAMWSIDWNLSLATRGFRGVLYHVSGSSVYYNPFRNPTGRQSRYQRWQTYPLYYMSIFLADALGGGARVADLTGRADVITSGTGTMDSRPVYGIWDDATAVLSKLVLINYQTGSSAAYTANLTIPAGTSGTLRVKRLSAPTSTEKWNVTYASMSYNLGIAGDSDGRNTTAEVVEVIQCGEPTGSTRLCRVRVNAPEVVLVYLPTAGGDVTGPEPSRTISFATTMTTGTAYAGGGLATLTLSEGVLETSNGMGNAGKERVKGQDQYVFGKAGVYEIRSPASRIQSLAVAQTVALAFMLWAFT